MEYINYVRATVRSRFLADSTKLSCDWLQGPLYHVYIVTVLTVRYRIIQAQDVQLFNNGQRSISPFYIYSTTYFLILFFSSYRFSIILRRYIILVYCIYIVIIAVIQEFASIRNQDDPLIISLISLTLFHLGFSVLSWQSFVSSFLLP